MLDKILVAIDESASSEWAFDTALAMAKPLNAELVLVHVLDAFSTNSPKHPCVLVETFSTDLGDSAQKAYEQEWQQFVDRHSALLRQRQSEAEAAGVATTCIQTQGVPGLKVCEIARTEDIDLILVGNRDRTNQRELDNGSVSNYLVHHAPCSVTVVHPKTHSETALPSSDSRVAAVA
ncbi:universal stress protein family, putative [Synechococcus sp. PCC 7335]|uniref:universal stress protein n=1 Tax=Synechococcus sp. (strain ATCC 29403 / PCC 7335) TaxID=91464 RepID=UPI00017EC028|nr:universal stress protein [Synechococcus sp. PCC 7335]EDX87663.1 universal stress protein family, putative [Synechococcus sp. PCC 7335]